ncbi:MAG TPA: flavin reductase family protein [Thermoplasmata archaeon]|nr:flavin reductase family protein [Thermoplasmata archaeon]
MSGAPAPPDAFRRAAARWVTGVAVVTAREGARDHGLTVNSLTSVSLDPPLLLVSLMVEADTTPVVQRTRSFGASVLSASQRAISERFARKEHPETKFEGLPMERGASGVALVPGAVATFECVVEHEYPEADHLLFVGRVRSAKMGEDAPPLVFHRSHYAEADGEGRISLTTG